MTTKEFVAMVARLRTDEETEGGMTNDDAWSTVESLIGLARCIEPEPVREAGYDEDHGLSSDGLSAVREAAYRLYAHDSDDDIEIDTNAPVVRAGDFDEGDERYWVQAWVYVRAEDVGGLKP